jgi:hypothetical protein
VTERGLSQKIDSEYSEPNTIFELQSHMVMLGEDVDGLWRLDLAVTNLVGACAALK